MKTLKMKWLPLLLSVAIGMAFWSCNSNAPENPSSGENVNGNGVKNTFGDGRLIIGRWSVKITKNNTNIPFTFASNGDASQNDQVFGYWSYTPETRLLATTLNDWSWTLNMMTNHTLQGISVSAGKSYGFSRIKYVDENPNLIIGTWRSEDNTTECTFDGTNYTLTQNGSSTKGTYNITIKKGRTISNNTATITLNSVTYELTNLQGGYISFQNDANKYYLYYVE